MPLSQAVEKYISRWPNVFAQSHLYVCSKPTYDSDVKFAKKFSIPQNALGEFVRGRRGFALIVALSLMAFVLLLVLTMSTLVRVETSAAELQKKRLIARNNAMLGLWVAVGDVQKNLGLDSRVSARAEILGGSGGSEIAHPLWTGVWQPLFDENQPEGVDPRGRPENLAWLVSGNSGEGLNFVPNPAADGGAPADSRFESLAELRIPESPGSPNVIDHAVEAPVVEVEDGGFAYWVGDEGVKAKLSSVAENYDQQAQPLLPLKGGVGAFLELEDVFADPLDWRRVLDLGQVVDDPVVRDRLAADTTLHGHGVLADTLRGGLRLDLSAVMEMGAGGVESDLVPLLPGSRMFDGYIPESASASRGPAWDLLRVFGNLGQGGSDEAFAIRPREVENSRTTRIGVAPVIERFQMYLVPRLSGDLGGGGDSDPAVYLPRLYLLPAVVLWNPYNRDLEATDGLRFEVERSSGQINAWEYFFAAGYYEGNAWRKIQTGDGDDVGGFGDLLSSGGGGLTFDLRGQGGGGFTIPAGEGRVFTLTRNAQLANQGPFEMRPGARDFGLYLVAEDTIEVDETTVAGRDIHLDLRHTGFKISGFGPFGPGDIFLNLEMPDEERLVRVGILRWLDKASPRDTVSEMSPPPDFGEDPNGPEPLPVERDGITGIATPAYSPGFEDVAIGYEVGLKTAEAKLYNTFLWRNPGERPLATLNPRAPSVGLNETWNDGYDNNRPPNYGAKVLFTNQNIDHFGNENYLVDTRGSGDGATFVGFSDEPNGGTDKAAYFHLPAGDEPPTSVGDLRQLDLVGNDTSPGGVSRNLGPAFVVGEARAQPFVSRRIHTDNPLSEYRTPQKIDYQWLANRVLWDRFFVSTVPPAEDDLAFPLTNGLMTPYRFDPANIAADAADALRDPRESAGRLLVDGAFNINSTSVKAWESLFLRYLGDEVVTQGGSDAEADTTPFLPARRPLGGAFPGGDSSTPELYDGYRRLDRTEVRELAEAVVAEVRRRGPFTSLAAFVNRSLDRDDPVFTDARERGASVAPGFDPLSLGEFTLADLAQEPRFFGTLQAAIERAGLNDDFDDPYFIRKKFSETHPTAPGGKITPWRWGGTDNNAGAYGAYMEGAPGYLTQGVLLARLGPLLSARSDTFRIRSYGEKRNSSTGEVEARAWCEAIIQRLPDFVNDTDTPETRMEAIQAGDNETFGRRFVVVDFRWLNQDEL